MMRTKRLVAVVSGGLMTAAVIAGCGDSSDEAGDGGSGDGGDYCGMIEDVQSDFSSIGDGDATLSDMSSLNDRFSDIADAAPSDVSKEWKSMHTAIDDLVTALEGADVDADAPLSEAVTEALEKDKSKAQEITEAASSMTSMTTDAEAIQKNVKDECDIDLGSDASE